MSNSAAFDDEAREYAPPPFVMPLAMVQGGIFGNSAPCPNCRNEYMWQMAACRAGEDMVSVGPEGYYTFSPKRWLDWAKAAVHDLLNKPCDHTHELQSLRMGNAALQAEVKRLTNLLEAEHNAQ